MDDKPAAIDPLELLAHPPADRYSLLELSVEWDGLDDIRSRFAAALRVFVITKYPLDWLGDRDNAWVTANADGDTLELPLHVALDEIQRRLQSTDGDLPSAIAPLVERVVVAATHNQGIVLAGAYADMALRGEISRLIDTDVGGVDLSLGTPGGEVSVRSDGWEPIGLGAIQDLVQDRVRSGRPRSLARRTAAGESTRRRLPGACRQAVRISRGPCRGRAGDVRRASGGATPRHRVENPSCSHEQHSGLARDRAWLLPGERRSRSRPRLPDPSASTHGAGS